MNEVFDFLGAALPWIILVFSLAVFFVATNGKKSDNRENYGALGMSMGLAIGSAVSYALTGNSTTGMTSGMIFGLAIGTCIKKKGNEAER